MMCGILLQSLPSRLLLAEGARIKAYDPAAIENMRKLFPDIIYVQSIYEAYREQMPYYYDRVG